MAGYDYKSFLDDEKGDNTFSYAPPSYDDTNSKQWDNTTTPSEPVKVEAPTQVPSAPVAQSVDSPTQARTDLVVANQDAANAPSTWGREDDRDKYTSKRTGYTYDKPKESHKQDAYLGVMGFLSGYLHNMDTAEGMDTAYAVVADNQDRADRFKDVDYYEQKGYNPTDIASYLKTGKKEDLVKNKPEWVSAGNGLIFEKSTGATQNINGANAGKQVDKTVDLGGTIEIHYVDGTVETRPKTMTPEQGQNVRTVDLGDRIETYDANNNLISSQPKGAAPGTGKGGVEAQKKVQEDTQLTKQLDINKERVGKITSVITNADPSAFNSQLGKLPIVSQLTGDASPDSINRPSMFSNVWGKIRDKTGFAKGSQDLYDSYAELDGLATQVAISHAKASGASGINTEAEANRFRASAPTVDFSRDPETVRRQMLDLARWVNDNSESMRPSTTTTSSSAQGGSTAPAAPGSYQTSGGVSYTVSKS